MFIRPSSQACSRWFSAVADEASDLSSPSVRQPTDNRVPEDASVTSFFRYQAEVSVRARAPLGVNMDAVIVRSHEPLS